MSTQRPDTHLKEFDMTIKSFAKSAMRLSVSPITGVMAAFRDADKRPPAANWKQFIRNGVKDYFLPLTGAIAGVKKEISRQVQP